MKKTIDLKLDWLAFTYKPDYQRIYDTYGKENVDLFPQDINLFFAEFPEFDMIKDEFLILSGFSHYENVIGFMGVSDTCRISYNTPGYTSTEMGVNVSIPSHGLEWFFGLFDINIEDDDAVQRLFSILKERNCSCSRIDLCFDDFSKKFRPRQYIKWWFNEQIRTKFRKMTTASSLRECANTFYLGSRTTGRMLRIYDKDIQSGGEIDAVRYEFELHVKYAKDMFEFLIENKTIDFISYLRSYFEVINLDSSNRSYCSLENDWESWLLELDFSEQLPERVEIPEYTLSKRKSDAASWLLTACVGNIKGYVKVFGWSNLQEVVRNDTREMPSKYRLLLDLVRKENDLDYDPSQFKYSFDYEEHIRSKNGDFYEVEKHDYLHEMYSM